MKSNALQQDNQETARIVGHVELPEQVETVHTVSGSNDFLVSQAAVPWKGDALKRDGDRIMADINELRRENRWKDILALIHPVAEKWPELSAAGLDAELLREAAFALCRAGRYEEAIATITPLTISEPKNVMAWYNLGYSAYEALYATRRDRSIMTHANRRTLIAGAHQAFGRCQQLKPESIAFFYRDAMVFKDFEDKPRQAIPLFERAVANYEKMSRQEQEKYHQQRPKYIRSMYHLASCLLKTGRPGSSMPLLQKVLAEDQDRDHMAPVFKHFALAKTLHAIGRPAEALDHLDTAAVRAARHESVDYVHELAARCSLLLNQAERAGRYIDKIPVKRRRPYIRWTEADVLVAKGRASAAVRVLQGSAERDRRSRHKSLLRIARIYLSGSEYEQGADAAGRADTFCRDTYGNGCGEARFWQAACLYRLERYDEASGIVQELIRSNFSYPNLRKLTQLINDRQQLEKKTNRPAAVVTLVK